MKLQMRTAVLLTTALLTGSLVYSHDAKPVSTSTKEISITAAFQKIVVGSNIEIILVQDAKKSTVTVTGDENLVPFVNVTIDNGQLSISSKKNLKNRNLKIYIPVTSLSLLEMGNGASVSTNGILKMDDLKVLVHEGSKVVLQIVGNFDIVSGDDCDFVYEKYEKSNVIYVRQ
jgi:hypothetical protein